MRLFLPTLVAAFTVALATAEPPAADGNSKEPPVPPAADAPAKPAVPPIDAAAPATFETATFALG